MSRRPARTDIPMLNPSLIIAITCDLYGVSRDDVLGRSQARRHSWPRAVAAYLMRRLLPTITYREIGELFGRTHQPVMLAVQTVEALMFTEPIVNRQINDVMREVMAFGNAYGEARIDLMAPIQPITPEESHASS